MSDGGVLSIAQHAQRPRVSQGCENHCHVKLSRNGQFGWCKYNNELERVCRRRRRNKYYLMDTVRVDVATLYGHIVQNVIYEQE